MERGNELTSQVTDQSEVKNVGKLIHFQLRRRCGGGWLRGGRGEVVGGSASAVRESNDIL